MCIPKNHDKHQPSLVALSLFKDISPPKQATDTARKKLCFLMLDKLIGNSYIAVRIFW